MFLVLGFGVTFSVVFGLFVVFARRQAAAGEAKRLRQEEDARKRQVQQARSDDLWRANKGMKLR